MDVVNIEQAAAWNGHEGDVWTEQADRYDRASRRVVQHLVDADVVESTDRVLDIGCGTGGLARLLARRATAGSVLGVDLSARMLDLARRRSADEGLTNTTFVQGDAQVFPFDRGAADVAVSSFGTMFFNDPVAAFTNIAVALGTDGRLAMMTWRSLPENEWLTLLRGALALGRDLPMPPPDAPTPFALADPDRVRALLGSAGFTAVELMAVDEPVELGRDAADALDFAKTMGIVEGLTEALDDEQRATAMTQVADLFARHETADGVLFRSAAWLITASKQR